MMSLCKHLIILIVICLLSGFIVSVAQTGASSTTSSNNFKPAFVSYYRTNNAKLSIQNVIKVYTSGQFKPLKQSVLNAGIPDQYYWMHFTITNRAATADSLVINIDNARLNELELFEMAGNTVKSLGKLGDFYPFSQRSFLHKNFIYPVQLHSHQTKKYFLYVNQVGHACVLPVKIYTAKAFSSSTFKDYLFDGVTYGILLFVGILSLLFFLTSRYYLYLFYSLYIITAILWFLSYFGLGYQYLWGNYPFLNTAMAPVMASLNVLLNLQICQILLRLRKSNKLLNNFANGLKAALILSALFPLFINLNSYGYTINHHYLIGFLCTILLAMIVVSISVVHYALKGFIAARLYLIASLLKAGSIINLALLEPGIAPAVFNMEGLLQVGIFVEITMLTYALASRYSIFKVKTFKKVIEAHEKERSIISQEIHDGITNSLTGINYGIEDLTKNTGYQPDQQRQLRKIHAELDKLRIEARNISHNTMPDYIKNNSISGIVEKYIAEIQNKTGHLPEGGEGIRICFSANEPRINFSEAVKLNIFRITQELIANILRHSKATHADLLLSFGKRELTIIAEDNGIGYKPANNEKKDGMGIKNIRSRVDLLDGSVSIHSPLYKRNAEPENPSAENNILPAEHGTMIKIKIPYRDNLLHNKNGYDY